MYVLYYVSMLRYWQLIWILIRTNHSCRTSIIWHRLPYFWKPTVRILFNARIRTIVVSTSGKLGFTFCNLLFVMTHLRQGKKVSVLPLGDVNQQIRCLKARFAWGCPYRAVGADVRHAMSHDRVPRVSRDLGMSCGHFCKTWIRSYDVCSAVHAALNVWAPLRG
jgi:hypothetical protein